jgi:hypothetical protein
MQQKFEIEKKIMSAELLQKEQKIKKLKTIISTKNQKIKRLAETKRRNKIKINSMKQLISSIKTYCSIPTDLENKLENMPDDIISKYYRYLFGTYLPIHSNNLSILD